MSVPQSSGKPTLQKGQIGLFHLTISTLANVGPAQGIFFSVAFLASTMGYGSPFGMLLAAIAIITVGNALAAFSRELPSAGSFVTFISRTFGAYVGITVAITVSFGYIIAISGVIIEVGGWLSAVLHDNFEWNIPWQPITIVSVLIIAYLVVRGIRVSSQWAVGLFFTEAAVLIIFSMAVLFQGGANGLHFGPFSPNNITGGLKSLGLAFPLLVFSFVGFENSAALAEEADDPRRNIPRALFWAIGIVGFLLVLSTYAAVEGYGFIHMADLGKDSAPFNTLAHRYLGGFGVFLIDIVGFTSLFACVIAATNSQSRIIFHAGREGLIPRLFGRIHYKHQTPWTALLTYLVIAVALVVIVGWKMNPLDFYADMGSLGTIPIVLMYLVTNVALPVYMWRNHRSEFNWFTHGIIPVIGLCVLGWSLWSLVQPGQPAPFNWFPYIVLGVIIVSFTYALWLGRKDRYVLDVAAQTLAE